MSRGSTWGEEEIRDLIEIWSDESIQSLLEKSRRNGKTFSLISARMKAKGYDRSTEQCHLKMKKLRLQYTKVCDVIKNSDGSVNEKMKCPFYDDLDSILGSGPTTYSIKVLESPQPSTCSTSTDGEGATPPDIKAENVEVEASVEAEVEGNLPQEPPRRKRKRQKDGGRLGEYKRLLEEFNRAEDIRQAKEDSSLERWMKTLLETEERHFKMLLEHQAANNSMFINFMHMFMQRMSPRGPPHAASQSPLPSQYNPPSPGPSEWTAQLSPSLPPSPAPQVSFQLCHKEEPDT